MSATLETLRKWRQQQQFRLELTNVHLNDVVATGEQPHIRRTLNALGSLRAHPTSISVAGRSIESLTVYVTVGFVPEASLSSGEEDGPFGWVNYLPPQSPEGTGELTLKFVLPMEFRERFTNRGNLPVVLVTLEGFTEPEPEKQVTSFPVRWDKQWDTEKHLRVVQCSIVDQSDEVVKCRIEDLRAEAATAIATLLVGTRPMYYNPYADGVEAVHDPSYRPAEVTAAQIESVKESAAYRAVCALIETACQQQGNPGGYQSLQRAREFLDSSGMVYRLRVATMVYGKSEKTVSLDDIPAIFPNHFPDRIALWWTPRFTWDSRGEGVDSMETCQRAELAACAREFYRSGVRCQWFEKTLLEALVSAEFYAAIKHAKTEPSVWMPHAGFMMMVLCMWAYRKSRGGNPSYSMWVLAGRIVFSLVKLGIVLALGWQALGTWDRNHSLANLIWLVILGGVLAGMVGRYLAQVIAGWLRPPKTAAVLLQGTPFGRVLTEMGLVYHAVTAPIMSTSAARETVLKLYQAGGGLDQIIVAYLDRALAAGEYEWNLNVPYLKIK